MMFVFLKEFERAPTSPEWTFRQAQDAQTPILRHHQSHLKVQPKAAKRIDNNLPQALWPRKSRTIAVRIISMALTGYYKTLIRPRQHRPLSMLKYDPVVKKKVLFLEAKRGGSK
ncbi:hypothetical protein VTO58DRAFT_104455 [Aureobasidium pullulans]